MQSINPVNGQRIKEYPEPSPEEGAPQIDRTQRAWLAWRDTSFAQRSGVLHKMAEVLRFAAPALMAKNWPPSASASSSTSRLFTFSSLENQARPTRP